MPRISFVDTAMDRLLEVGRQLDRDIYPRVLDGGIVKPSDAAAPNQIWANHKEQEHEKGQRRSETRSWQRSSRGQRSPSGGGASSQAAHIVCTDLQDLQVQYERELVEVLQAYPRTHVWYEEDGIWLLTESTILSGLQKKAVFLTGIPYSRNRNVRAWGFWAGPPLAHPIWIGPRHTNFGDGSICAFAPRDGAWMLGESILALLDIYSLWALRHHHLQIYGRWPGRQIADLFYERFLELRSDELCGCGSIQTYGECCQKKDLSRDLLADAMDFYSRSGSNRTPPDAVAAFIRSPKEPPRICEILPALKVKYKKYVFGHSRILDPIDFSYNLT